MSGWRDLGAVSSGLVLGAFASQILDGLTGGASAAPEPTSEALLYGVSGMIGGAACAWVAGRDAPRAPLWMAATIAGWLLYRLARTRSDHERELGWWGLTGATLGVLAGARLWTLWREMRRG